LQVLTLKDSFKPSFACVVRVLARALDFVAGQITQRGASPRPTLARPACAGV
jgi:hypothetical protein